jgi:methyl-accepting chemotaxis protein
MRNGLSIKLKLIVGICVVIFTLIAGAGTSIYCISELNGNIDTVAGTRMPQLQRAAAITEAIHTSAIHIDEAMLARDPETVRKELEITVSNRKETNENMDRLKSSLTTEKEKELFQKVLDSRKPYVQARDGMIALVKEGKKEEALTALESVRPLRRSFLGALNELRDQVRQESDAAAAATQNGARSARNIILILSLSTVIITSLIFLWIVRSITTPLRSLIETANRIAERDLTLSIEATDGTETGQLMSAMANMAQNLGDIVARTSRISDSIASASGQLQSTSREMAQGAEEAADQTHSVVAASEEMSATAADIARNCHAAARNSEQADATAQAGTRVVADSVEAMHRIAERVNSTARGIESLGERSDQIGAIVATIEDIADQTNLLALNAAIEAARAGDQGRGFAVVADEVRALAERTTRATREIGDMIKAIQQETRSAVTAMEEGVREVRQGTEAAAKSGRALQDILDQIKEVSQQVNQIAIAAEEQTATISEITANTHRIAQVVQNAAQGSQDSAAAATHLARMSEDLNTLVGQFRLA